MGLLERRRADHVLVGDCLAVALFLALEIEVADADGPGAVIDAKDASFLFVAAGEQAIIARRLSAGAVGAAIAGGDPVGARADICLAGVMGELAGDYLAGQLVEPVEQGEIDLRGGEELVAFAAVAWRRRRQRRRYGDGADAHTPASRIDGKSIAQM